MIPICQVPPERDSTPLGQRVPENVAAETIEKRDADSERCETRQSLDDEQSWKRFTPLKKKVITSVVIMSGFNAAMDSMIISSAIPEVASTFNTTGSIINISNGLYMLSMALCPLFWGPLSQVFGRRWVSQVFSNRRRPFSSTTQRIQRYFAIRKLIKIATILDRHHNHRSLRGIFSWHRAVPQPSVVHHLPQHHGLPGYSDIPDRLLMHWGYISPKRKSHGVGLVPVRDSSRPRVRALLRRSDSDI
jgi:hypothetical protein